jgi:hypothetical protein
LRLLPETPRNQELCCQISRDQFVCDCSHGAPVVTCLGSTSMTVDGKPLLKGRTVTLGQGGSIVIAAVMTMEYRVLSMVQGAAPAKTAAIRKLMPALFDRADAVMFRVRSQGPERGFVMVNGRLPIGAAGDIGSTTGVPAGYVYCDRGPETPNRTGWLVVAEGGVNIHEGVLRQSEALRIGHMTRLNFPGTLLDFESMNGWASHCPWTQPETAG